jgi:hypothetical protein
VKAAEQQSDSRGQLRRAASRARSSGTKKSLNGICICIKVQHINFATIFSKGPIAKQKDSCILWAAIEEVAKVIGCCRRTEVVAEELKKTKSGAGSCVHQPQEPIGILIG